MAHPHSYLDSSYTYPHSTMDPAHVFSVHFERASAHAYAPEHSTPGSVGFDLRIPADFEATSLRPWKPVRIDTGIRAVCNGCYVLLCERSSLRARGVTFFGPGIIDCDYTGTLVVVLHNLNPFSWPTLKPGDKIAQAVPVVLSAIDIRGYAVGAQPRAAGNAGGFGSTGA